MLFFTFARNIIPSYSMFALFPLSFLVGKLMIDNRISKRLLIVISMISVVILTITIVIASLGMTSKKSEKHLVLVGQTIFDATNIEYSARFYSQDAVVQITPEQIDNLPSGSLIIAQKDTIEFETVKCLREKCLYRKQ